VISDAAASLRTYASVAEAVQMPDFPSVAARLTFRPLPDSRTSSFLRPFSGRSSWCESDGSTRYLLEEYFLGVAALRMNGLTLAIRLYELDKGTPLDRLDKLVPEYVASLPKDPFDPNGGPIHMGRWGGHELLYSCGDAGRDLGGRYARDANNPSAFYEIIGGSYSPFDPGHNLPCFYRGFVPWPKLAKYVPDPNDSAPGLPPPGSETGALESNQ